MRSLLFSIWIKAGKEVPAVLALLESLAAAEYENVSRAGARIIRASLAGKSFDYEMPAGWSADEFAEAIRLSYREIKIGGASGGQMTDAELEAYILDSSGQVTDTLRATFAYRNAGGRV